MPVAAVSIDPITGEMSIRKLDEHEEEILRKRINDRSIEGRLVEVRHNKYCDFIETVQDIIATLNKKRTEIRFRRFSLSINNEVFPHPLEIDTSFTQKFYPKPHPAFELVGDGGIGRTGFEFSSPGVGEGEWTTEPTFTFSLPDADFHGQTEADCRRRGARHRREFRDRGGERPRKGAYQRHNWLSHRQCTSTRAPLEQAKAYRNRISPLWVE